MIWLRQLVMERIREGMPPFLVFDPWHWREMGLEYKDLGFFAPQVALLHGQLRRDDHGREFNDFCSGRFTQFQDYLEIVAGISGARDLILEADWWHIIGLKSALSQRKVTEASIRFLERSKEVFG
jgi:hypothetical protein